MSRDGEFEEYPCRPALGLTWPWAVTFKNAGALNCAWRVKSMRSPAAVIPVISNWRYSNGFLRSIALGDTSNRAMF